ncbi:MULTISPECIES: PaaX family transcriptional regulator [Brevibacterium]|uniref:PaaX family transcriptional regulator n=1 Tax=Brevibacterium TaxID=1696 RepID=UPI0031E46B71
MSDVQLATKRRRDVGDRYRLTRIAFDVVSVFGCLRASGVPGPIIVRILADHGYSASSVRNQLTRMAQRDLISLERCGRVTQYRLSPRILAQFRDISGDRELPEFTGRFHAALYTIPETSRPLRDRFQYVARMLGYRQLRAGVLIGFADRSHALRAQLPGDIDGGWYECTQIVPADLAAAKRMTAIAFELAGARRQIEEFEVEISRLGGPRDKPGAGLPELPIGRFFDLYYRVGRAVMENPLLPAEIVGSEQPSQRFRTFMDRCNLEYYLRYDQQVREAAAENAAFDLIEWLPEG